ncbi:hypothetical protein GCM10010307_47700 [Streptomyces vastus]|uniref:Uncharacterized protein n=1 Tax=Streptomyces vastus TaxID=285451 RepID=A0ABN3R4Z4_9ACTN
MKLCDLVVETGDSTATAPTLQKGSTLRGTERWPQPFAVTVQPSEAAPLERPRTARALGAGVLSACAVDCRPPRHYPKGV